MTFPQCHLQAWEHINLFATLPKLETKIVTEGDIFWKKWNIFMLGICPMLEHIGLNKNEKFSYN